MTITEEPMAWKSIWEKKGKIESSGINLKKLIAIDGFDTGAGDFPVDSWLSYVEKVKRKLTLEEKQKILEVGCGAGAFLLPIYNSGLTVYGIDYSTSLIQLCSQVMDSGTFKVSEANNITFEDEFFDAVVSNSVFQYFSSLGYAEKVVGEIARVLKTGGRAALLDINDAAKQEVCELIRREKLGDEEYNRLYGSLSHQFYHKEWFEKIAEDLCLKYEIQEQAIIGYDNSNFRYNVFLTKNG